MNDLDRRSPGPSVDRDSRHDDLAIATGPMRADERREANKANWESRVPIRTGPGGYNLAAFDEPEHLSNVVR